MYEQRCEAQREKCSALTSGFFEEKNGMRFKTLDFPVGYHKVHPIKLLDYQLNRWHSLGYLPLEPLREAASRIRTMEDWKPEMMRQAESAQTAGRMIEAAFFYRSAEFFVMPSDPDKRALYEKFQGIFYQHVFDGARARRVSVPYEGGSLPALHFLPHATQKKGTLVVISPQTTLSGSVFRLVDGCVLEPQHSSHESSKLSR
jgi:hypothetical protein